MIKLHKKIKEMEEKILFALFRYYLNDITFERAAEDGHVPIYYLVQYVNDHNLPIVHTEKDVTTGVHKVMGLMKTKGMNVKTLKFV